MSQNTGPEAPTWEAESFNADDNDVDLWSTAAPSPETTDTLAPFVDPAIEAELQEGPAAWMGIRWRDIASEDKAEAWTELRQWADWFIREYQVKSSMLPPCWFEHADMVAELYAAMCAEYKVWEEGSPGLGAMTTWHPHVQALRARLAAMTAARTCNAKKMHAADQPDLPWRYEEARWTQVRDGALHTTDLPRADEDRWWRPSAVTDKGEIISGPETTVSRSDMAQAALEAVTVLSDASSKATRARIQAVGAVRETYWEYSETRDGPWTRHIPDDSNTGC